MMQTLLYKGFAKILMSEMKIERIEEQDGRHIFKE